MPQNSDQSSPNWRGSKGKPERKVKKAEWQQRGQAVVSTEGWARKLRVGCYFGALALCVAGLIGLYFILRLPNPPLFVIIANNPEPDVLNLDRPLDFYGWKGASKLAQWLKADKDKETPTFLSELLNSQQSPNQLDDGKPTPLQTDTKGLVNTIANKAGDARFVFAYFGVMGSVNENGPFLYASGGSSVPVKTLLEELRDHEGLKKLKVVLFFDAARLHHAPRLGVIHNDFVKGLKKVYKEANPSNILIISSSSEDELAWDSEPAGTSVFLDRLMDALQKGDQNSSSDIHLEDLMKKLESQSKWTSDRYITKQTVELLPADDALKQQIKFPTLSEEIRNPDPLNDAKLESTKEFAVVSLAQSIPGPEVYTPLRWRYYRELLARYEKAVMAQDTACVNRLVPTLHSLEEKIKAEGKLTLGKAAQTTRAMNALVSGKKDDGSIQPVEDHFAGMLEEFKKTTKLELDPKLTEKAVKLRQTAERMAVSLPEDDKQFPYSERIWPLIHDTLVVADGMRREGEDLIFATDDESKKKANQLLEDAGKKYAETGDHVKKLQHAWRTYHTAASVLPDLILWRSYKSMPDHAASSELLKPYLECSASFLKLQSRLAEIEKDKNWKENVNAVGNAAIEVEKQVKVLLSEYQDSCKQTCTSPKDIFLVECAVSVPFIPNSPVTLEHRLTAMKEALKTGRKYFKVSDQKSTDAMTIKWDQVAQQRVKLMYSLMNRKEPSDLLEIKELTLAGLPKGPAKNIQSYWLNLTAVNVDEPTQIAEKEINSRLALTSAEPTFPEPAVLLRNQQWKRVRKDQAMRFALDHWYGPSQHPYFRDLAEACLVEGEKPELQLQKILDTGKMELTPQQQKILWTSEQSQDVIFNLKIPLVDQDKNVAGSITTWPTLTSIKKDDKPALRLSGNKGRQSRKLTGDKEIKAPVALLPSKNMNDDDNLTLTQNAYFRGQLLPPSVQIDVFQQPSRIITWQKPTEPASFVVNSTGDLGVGLGHLAIVLDYSGSMLTVGDNEDPEPWYKDENERELKYKDTRYWKAIETLDGILRDLPNETSMTIYLFSDFSHSGITDKITEKDWATYTKNTFPWQLFSGSIIKKGESGYRLRGSYKGNDNTEVDSKEFVGDLKATQPHGLTPLIQSMKYCIEKNANRQTTTTLLVLTDGMDTSEGNLVPKIPLDPKVKEDKIKSLRAEYLRAISSSSMNLHLMFFRAPPDEAAIAKQVFDVSSNNEVNHRVKLHPARDTKELNKALTYALRPRVRLLKADGDAVDFGDRQGWEVTPSGEMIINMTSTPGIDKGPYTLTLSSNSNTHQGQQIYFDKGDFMFLELSPSKDRSRGLVSIKRKLFVDILDKENAKSNRPSELLKQERTPWNLCLAENYEGLSQGQGYRNLVLTLESDKALAVENGRLQLNPPDRFAWWSVEYLGKDNKPLPLVSQPKVQVQNMTRYFAPAWTVRFDASRLAEAQKVLINVQPVQEDGQDNSVILKSCKDVPKQTPDKKYTVRCFHVEKYQRYDSNELFTRDPFEKSVPALAVQVQQVNPQQGPFQLQVEMKDGPAYTTVEHVYYEQARSMTVYFCGIEKKDFEDLAEQARINLIHMKAEGITLNLSRVEATTKIPHKVVPPFSPIKK